MKEVNYYKIFQKNYEESIKRHAEIIKQNYKKGRVEGDAENLTYNNVLKNCILNKKGNLEISSQKFSKIISTYNNRGSLTHKDFPNRIFTKFLKPIYDELKISKSNYSFVKLLKELAEYQAFARLSSNYSHNSQIYKMMYDLNDFNEFDVSIYYSSVESTPLFKKLHKRCFPKSYKKVENDEQKNRKKKINSFLLKKECHKNLNDLYDYLVSKKLINSEKTTSEDFSFVLKNNWIFSDESKIHITNNQQFSYLISKIQFW